MKPLHFLISLLFCITVYAQNTESPYLKVLTQNANVVLKSTDVNVQISGAIAHVHISQVYKNTGDIPLESTYVFPLSTEAAVHKMEMQIDNRIIQAKIYEKQKAQEVYNKAVKEGKRAAKLDQERPNVFKMNLANLMPNDEITVDLFYTEMLTSIDSENQFVFPTVIGPRFMGEKNHIEQKFVQAYVQNGTNNSPKFSINICLNAGMYIQNIRSSSHKLDINYASSETAEIFLAEKENTIGNKDFILNYSCRTKEINSGLLLFEGEKENFFAYTIEPPTQILQEKIPPREYVFVIDVSGSMTGYPLDISKELMRNLLGDLKETDVFNILLFSGGSKVFKNESVTVNSENLNEAMKFLSDDFGGGGTYLLDALETAYNLPRTRENSARTMVVITDGYVSVEREAFNLIRNNRSNGNVFTFGIGSSVNRYLVEGLSKVANTPSYIANTLEEAHKMALQFKKDIEFPVLTQLKFKSEGFEVYDVEPSKISDLFSNRAVTIYGKWKGEPKGKIIVEGKLSEGNYKSEYLVSNGTLSKFNTALKYLWARKKIEQLDDYNFATDETKKQVIDLSLKYNLLTRYTSFVAVDNVVVNKNEHLKSRKVSLPLPSGMSKIAIGAEAEIEEEFLVEPKLEYQLNLPDELSKGDKRKAKIWFNANYGDVNFNNIGKNNKLRIIFNENGSLKEVRTFNNNKWEVNVKYTKMFLKQSSHLHTLNKEFYIEIEFPSLSKNSVVFVAGKDKGSNKFYEKAKEYFLETNISVVENVSSLNGIINWLNTNFNGKPYSEIHIVTHGNNWRGLSLKLTDSGNRITEELLQNEIENNRISKLANVFSNETKIIFHSCGLGANKSLVKTLKSSFNANSDPTVYASKKFSVFGGVYSNYFLAEAFYQFYPTANSPGNVDLSKAFAKKYPNEEIDWLKTLYLNSEFSYGKEFTYKFNIPIKWKLNYSDKASIPNLASKMEQLDFIASNPKFSRDLFALNIPLEKFRWIFKTKENSLIIEGKTTVVCILKPITDDFENGKYAPVDIENEEYFYKV